MRQARALKVFGVFAGIAVVAAVAIAQETSVQPLPDNPPVNVASLEVDWSKTHWGDAKAGQAKAGVCAACHGADGNPAVAVYPRLAGQNERYIAQQVALIANGQRTTGAVAAMVPFVRELAPQDMRDIGAYFAQQKGGAGVADDSVIADGAYKGLKFYEAGQKLYRGGDAARGIPACMACHGPDGAGNPGAAYPRIGGQHQEYVSARLTAYQAGGMGKVDPQAQVMEQIAHALTGEEIAALSTYLQGLHDHGDDIASAK